MKLTLPTILMLGAGAYLLFGRKATAATPAPVAPTTDSGGMPLPSAGETGQQYSSRVESWGLRTGQAYPTIEGYGRTGPMWRGMGMVPR